jgi:hypothetical protein
MLFYYGTKKMRGSGLIAYKNRCISSDVGNLASFVVRSCATLCELIRVINLIEGR